MKTIVTLIGLSLFFVACGSNSENEEKKELTYDEKVEAVCDCLNKSDSPNERMKCLKLQDDYHKSLEDKKKIFLQTTNECL